MINNRKAIILYIVFGMSTTLLNIFSYYVLTHYCGVTIIAGTGIAWFLTITAAFLTNKQWVYGSNNWKTHHVIKEALTFFGCRTITGIAELMIMFIFVERLCYNDLIIKTGANIFVIIINYIAGKIIIFKH